MLKLEIHNKMRKTKSKDLMYGFLPEKAQARYDIF